jgi:hypothetical protein
MPERRRLAFDRIEAIMPDVDRLIAGHATGTAAPEDVRQLGSNPVVPTSIPTSMPRSTAGDGILNLSRTHSFLFQSAEHRVN